MGESEGEGQQRQRGDDAQETNDVRRCPQEDRCGPTRSMGKGESRKENRLTKKRKAVFHMPRLSTSLGIFIGRVISMQFSDVNECNGLFMSVMQPFGIGKLYGLQNPSS
jgi:hypothetical protein